MELEMELYRHYKGGLYLRLFVAQTHNHNGDLDVAYFSLSYQKPITRPLNQDSRKEDAWTDIVEWPDGIRRQRFTCEAELDVNTTLELHKIWSAVP